MYLCNLKLSNFAVLKVDMFLWGLFRFHDAALMREAHFFVPGVRWQPPPWPRLVFHATRPGSPGKGTRFYGVERVILAKFCLLIDLCLAQDSGLPGLQKPLRLSASSPPTVRLGRRPLCCRAQSRKCSAAEDGLCATWQPLLPV